MRPNLKIFVASLAAIPVAVAAQTYGTTEQQQPAQTTAQQAEQLKPATSADVKAGASVFDQKGDTVGKVDSVDSEGVVISTGAVRAKIPLSSVGVGGKGLVIGVTKAELEAEAKKASKAK